MESPSGKDASRPGRRATRSQVAFAAASFPPAQNGTRNRVSGFVSGAKRVISCDLLFSSPEDTGSGEEEEADDEQGNGLNLDKKKGKAVPKEVERAINPDCANASNTYHKCGENCKRKG